jgi:hypothetical protein
LINGLILLHIGMVRTTKKDWRQEITKATLVRGAAANVVVAEKPITLTIR